MRSYLLNMFGFAFLFLQSVSLLGQSNYEEIAKQDIMDYVFAFVSNREKFKSYGCLINASHQDLHQSGLGHSSWDASIFEDSPNKLRRSDVKRANALVKDDSETMSEDPIWSTFSVKGKTRSFEGDVEFKPDRMEGMKRFSSVPDPWMATISEISLSELGLAGGSNYWINVFDEKSLLWAESNGEFVRSEWRFGKGEGECYVQVYFSNDSAKLPVLVRYLFPRDWKARFSKKGLMVSENEIVWEEFGEGFVPVEIRCQREDFWESKPGTKSSTHGSMALSWKTKFCDDEGIIDQRVFTPKALSFEEIKSSFEVGRKRKPPISGVR